MAWTIRELMYQNSRNWGKYQKEDRPVTAEQIAQQLEEATQDFEPIKKFKDKRPRRIDVDIPTSGYGCHLNLHGNRKGNLIGRL